MPKYTITITRSQTFGRTVDVEADDEDQAGDKAVALVKNEKVEGNDDWEEDPHGEDGDLVTDVEEHDDDEDGE